MTETACHLDEALGTLTDRLAAEYDELPARVVSLIVRAHASHYRGSPPAQLQHAVHAVETAARRDLTSLSRIH